MWSTGLLRCQAPHRHQPQWLHGHHTGANRRRSEQGAPPEALPVLGACLRGECLDLMPHVRRRELADRAWVEAGARGLREAAGMLWGMDSVQHALGIASPLRESPIESLSYAHFVLAGLPRARSARIGASIAGSRAAMRPERPNLGHLGRHSGPACARRDREGLVGSDSAPACASPRFDPPDRRPVVLTLGAYRAGFAPSEA
jgi:hypothetical protein